MYHTYIPIIFQTAAYISTFILSCFVCICVCVWYPSVCVCSVVWVCISVYLSHYSGIGGQLAGWIMCLNSSPEGGNQTTLWGGGWVSGLTAWSHTNYTCTKHISSLYQYCISCHHSGVCEWQLWCLLGVQRCKCVYFHYYMCVCRWEMETKTADKQYITFSYITFFWQLLLSKATYNKCIRAEINWWINLICS